MWKRLFLLLAILAVAHAGVDESENVFRFVLSSGEEADTTWWTTAVFYQIYPRSFMDSDNDGYGDLEGIISRLPHFKDAGITATWLSPIFQSPQVDQGYDISDYYTIDPIFGTVDDFKRLLTQAHLLGIKIILDFVPNHTSDKHEWFQKSENKTEGYEDYYIWHDGIKDPDNATNMLPPNNWISNFKGSAWTWSDKRQQFYYHQFEYRQPDLNYSNPSVVQDMKDVLTYWMKLGVDGFRIDAVPYLFEDPTLRDESLVSGLEYDLNNPNCLDHTYTKDLANTFDIIYQWRSHVDQYAKDFDTDTIVLMTEAYSPIDKQMLYYGSSDGSKLGAHFTFNFNLITNLQHTNFTIDQIVDSILLWMVNIPEGYTSNWVLGNHDNHRVATRLGKENVDGLNMLTAILPGVMVTYNGEEIGMEDGEVTCKQGFDPQAIKNCSTFDEISRDFERTPFQWDNSTNAGFNKGNATWLPVSKKYKEMNLEFQNTTTNSSHYKVYKQLLEFRKNFQKTIIFESLTVAKLSNEVFQIIRRIDDKEYMLVYNIGENNQTLRFLRMTDIYNVTVASTDSNYEIGDLVTYLELKPHESVILQNTGFVNGSGYLLPSIFLLISLWMLVCFLF